tara:strand:- start:2243 stop:5074 length:2832 start_codon:yes stop_codon:yes gene_type:complete
MANIKKSFNFRSGVQVDDDNLVVSPTGLIGIGTTVPTQALDIRGDFVCTGLTSSVTGKIGVLTVTSLDPTEIIGAGVSIKSGIITGQAGDIVTYFGDGGNLLNLPTSQWEDTNAGFAVSSIYNRGSTVGIATTNPQSTLQIGNNPDAGEIGVGIASAGHIKASGIITATGFVGNLTGDVTGNVTGNVSGEVTGTTVGQINVTSGISTLNDVKVLGIITASSGQNKIPALYATLADLPSATEYHGMFAHVHATGRGYYSHAGAWFELVNKESDGRVGTGTELYNIKLVESVNLKTTGVSTFSADTIFAGDLYSATWDKSENALTFADDAKIEFGGLPTDNPDLEIYHGTAFDIVTDKNWIKTNNSNDLMIDLQGGSFFVQNRVNPNSFLGFEPMLNAAPNAEVNLYYNGSRKFQTTQEGVEIVGVSSASGDVTTLTKIGIGTHNPANDFQIRKTGSAELQITSDTDKAGITIGREPQFNNNNNAEIRYGGDVTAQYSSAESLDIINYGKDNFNYHLSGSNAGAVTGDFHWHKGINNQRLMTLTNTGRLGIGITVPTTHLDVVGGAKISSNLEVGNNLTVTGSINSDITGNVTGTLTGNVNAESGTSNFNNINVSGISTLGTAVANNFGIGLPANTTSSFPLTINQGTSQFFVTGSGNVGVGTDDTLGHRILTTGSLVSGNIGIGSTIPRAAVDFSVAGRGLGGILANKFFMIPPKLSNSDKTTISGSEEEGAFIFNSTTNKLEVYSGGTWTALEANSGGGEVNQNAFANVAVSGQSTVQADAKTDTLNLVAGANMTITTNAAGDQVTFASSGGGGGSSLQSRTTGSVTAPSIANGASTNITITAAKSYILQKIQTNVAAWVTVYTDQTSRTNDASRAETTDPTPGSGVIAEVITTGSQTQILSPGVIGWNNDGTPSTNAYVKAVNKSGGNAQITVTLHFVKLED